MKNWKKKTYLILLLPISTTFSTALTSCSCSSKKDEFNEIYYGCKTPIINKKNRKKVMNIAINHFEEQWNVIEYGSTITKDEFNNKIKIKPITCYQYYWNWIYYFANICSNKEIYQIVKWENNDSESNTITGDIILNYNGTNRTLLPKESYTFEYNYDNNGTILITLANDSIYTIPSYVASYIKVII